MPMGGTIYGFIRSISQKRGNVNGSGDGSAVTKNETDGGFQTQGQLVVPMSETTDGSADIIAQNKGAVNTERDGQNVDRYTAKQYNDFGWVAVNNVLTGKELKKLYSQFAKVKVNKEYSFKNKLGEYLIPVGDKYGSIDKIVYIKGTKKHPIIRQVVVLNKTHLENAEKHIMEVVKYEATGLYYDAFEIHMAYAGEGIFSLHKALSFPSYSELKNERARGRDGQGTHDNGREGDAGGRVSEIRSGEVRSDNGRVSSPDIVANDPMVEEQFYSQQNDDEDSSSQPAAEPGFSDAQNAVVDPAWMRGNTSADRFGKNSSTIDK